MMIAISEYHANMKFILIFFVGLLKHITWWVVDLMKKLEGPRLLWPEGWCDGVTWFDVNLMRPRNTA